MIVVLAFLTGAFKRYSYMAILIMHLISALSTYARYFDPRTGTNLLLFAALPMLAGCWAIWSLCHQDTLQSIDAMRAKR
jgi:putative oxidoreductase